MPDPARELEQTRAALERAESDRCLHRQAAREAQCEADRLKALLLKACSRLAVCSELLTRCAERRVNR